MELAKCKCMSAGNTCVDDEPYDGSCETLSFKEKIESYQDYLDNNKFCNSKKISIEQDFKFYQRKETENRKQLKNLFLTQFVSSDKEIKGLCIHETKMMRDPYFQKYFYIVGVNTHDIGEEGINAYGIQMRFRVVNGDLTDVIIHQDSSYYIDYETLCSCQITKKEFMTAYDRANFKIIEGLGLNKVDSKL